MRGLHVSGNDREFAQEVGRAHDELMKQLERQPTIEEIAEYLTISVEEVRQALQARDELIRQGNNEPKAEAIAQYADLPLEKVRKIERVRKDIARKNTDNVTPERIAKRLHVDPQSVSEALDLLALRFESLGSMTPEEDEETVWEPPAVGPTPEEKIAWGQLLDYAIRKLPEPQRTVFILRRIEGLSVEETAEHLGMPEGTVKSHLSRAEEQLRQDPLLKDLLAHNENGGEGHD